MQLTPGAVANAWHDRSFGLACRAAADVAALRDKLACGRRCPWAAGCPADFALQRHIMSHCHSRLTAVQGIGVPGHSEHAALMMT
eukprot:7364264-Alexandrium_andersonii.AAC.1